MMRCCNFVADIILFTQMEPVFNEIKNWQLFVNKFGEDYSMHDAVVKRFDLNEDVLTVVINTVYEIDDEDVNLENTSTMWRS